jgi:hypothetical protein
MASFAFIYMLHTVCVWVQEAGSRTTLEGSGASIMQIRQSGYSMGLEWMRFCIRAAKAIIISIIGD